MSPLPYIIGAGIAIALGVALYNWITGREDKQPPDGRP